jgi:phosphatidate phosphatase APP1
MADGENLQDTSGDEHRPGRRGGVFGRLKRRARNRAWRLLTGADRDGGPSSHEIRRAAGYRDVRIEVFAGHGTRTEMRLRARVLAGPAPRPARAHDSVWKNLENSLRRFRIQPIPGVKVIARGPAGPIEAVSDGEGFVRFIFPGAPELSAEDGWVGIPVEIRAEANPGVAPAGATGRVRIPGPRAEYAVISDIDDTILETGVADRLRFYLRTVSRNAHTRTAFPGVAELYRAFVEGAGGDAANPVFYVSSSPWNLYDLLAQFVRLKGIPEGPMFLRDFGTDATKILQSRHEVHKLAAIREILGIHSGLPVVLIGDSGQQDPEIYRDVAAEFPDRVLAVYLRDVSGDARNEEVQILAAELEGPAVPLILCPTTEDAAAHAAAIGLVLAEHADAGSSEPA